MKIIRWTFEEWLKRFYKPDDLREQCREAYGDDFVKMYDMVNSGVPIGNLDETKMFLAMVEAVKQGQGERYKPCADKDGDGNE